MDSYIGNRPLNQAAGYRTEYIATAGQTVFAVSYAVGYVDVFLNGVKLGMDDFTATDGATVTLAEGAASGDLVAFIAWAKGTMVPIEDFYTKAASDSRFVNVTGGTITAPLNIEVSGVGLYVKSDGEGGELRLVETSSGKNASIDLVAESNAVRVYHSMAGALRIWTFKGDGSLTGGSATDSTGYTTLGQADGRYFRLNQNNSTTGNISISANDLILNPTAVQDNSNARIYMTNPRNLGIPAAVLYSYSSSAWSGLSFLIANSQYFSLRGDGYGYASVGWSPASDGRVKTDREVIGGALAKLSALTGYTYSRSDMEDDRRHAGLIAQDVQGVLPEAVSVMGGMNEKQPGDMLALDYNSVIALLVNAVNELQARVAALEG